MQRYTNASKFNVSVAEDIAVFDLRSKKTVQLAPGAYELIKLRTDQGSEFFMVKGTMLVASVQVWDGYNHRGLISYED